MNTTTDNDYQVSKEVFTLLTKKGNGLPEPIRNTWRYMEPR